MSDYKSPKLIKLYYKPSTDTTQERAYLRNISGSKLAGIFICHNEGQVNNIKASSKLALYGSMMVDSRQMLGRYKAKNTSFIGYNTGYVNVARANDMDKLYNFLLNREIIDNGTRDGYDIIMDVLKSYHHGVQIDSIISSLNNEMVETVDNIHTRIWKFANEYSYMNGDGIEGEKISLIASIYCRCCDDCSYIDYDDETDYLYYVEGGDYYICESSSYIR